MKIFLKLLLLIISFLFYIFYSHSVYAANTYVQGTVLINPVTSYPTCSNPNFCTTAGGECWNSQSPGSTDCGQACKISSASFGNSWTKYRYIGCVKTKYDALTQEETCNPVYDRTSAVYSTADKCSDGSNSPPSESYLRAGRCDGSIGGIYKTCCTGGYPSYVSSSSCVAVTPASGAPTPPMDGVCPAGTSSVQCGFGGLPSCGQEACGPLPLPTPSPPPSGCCSYPEDCTTSDGRAGVHVCPGINDSGFCRYTDSGSCVANADTCTTCVPVGQGGSSCGRDGCQTSYGETCSNCPRDCGYCNSGYSNPPPTRCTMDSSQKGMALYVDPKTDIDIDNGDDPPTPCPENRGCSGKFTQGDVFTVTGTAEEGDWYGQKFGCTQDIRLSTNGPGFDSCKVIGGFKCVGESGFQDNPKDSRACWFQWECRASTPGGQWNIHLEARNYGAPKTCDNECLADRGYTVIAAGKIRGSIFVDSNDNGLLDSGEKIIRNSSTPCSGANYVTDDGFSIGISGTKTMTIQPRLCNTASSDVDYQVPYFDTGFIPPTGSYTVTLNYDHSRWVSTNGDSRNISSPPPISQNQRTLFGVSQKPIGSHDGQTGIQPIATCQATGWAYDNDGLNPLTVKIYHSSTNNLITAATANFYRGTDLTGVCPNSPVQPGACAFSANLYTGATSPITLNVDHNIEVRAVDPQTGQEVLLPNTRKQIKCTNPIGAWIQTIGGDVHSNGRINISGGPP